MKKWLVSLFVLVTLLAVPAFGQIEQGDIPPDNIPLLPYERPVWEYVTGGMFLVVVLGIGFKASKRAHKS